MLTEIYIVRHGETDNNVKHRFIGSTDKPLNERGMRQAACLKAPMAKVALDRIYASPYKRTMMTAEQVRGDRPLEIITDRGLCEIHCGGWEDLNRAEIEELWPGMIDLWQNEPDKLQMPGGETFLQVQERAVAAFSRIVRENKGKRIAIVTHMLTIQLILAKLFDIPIKDVWNMNRLENTSVSKMNVWDNGDFEIVEWGKEEHLLPELKNTDVRIAGFVQQGFRPTYDVESLKGKHHSEAFAR